VVIGKRHLEQKDEACFAGAIDEVRIYDRALTADEIAALRPDRPSEIAPWAWWTFDTPEAKERTGRFGAARLSGGAAVENGKLVLDGKGGAMIASPAGK